MHVQFNIVLFYQLVLNAVDFGHDGHGGAEVLGSGERNAGEHLLLSLQHQHNVHATSIQHGSTQSLTGGEEMKVQLGHTLRTSRSKLENQGSAVSMSCENMALWVMQNEGVSRYSAVNFSQSGKKSNTTDVAAETSPSQTSHH